MDQENLTDTLVPNEARLRNLTYSSEVFVEVREWREVPGEETEETVQKYKVSYAVLDTYSCTFGCVRLCLTCVCVCVLSYSAVQGPDDVAVTTLCAP